MQHIAPALPERHAQHAPWYFGKVIVKYRAQNSAGMCCGQESSEGFTCQSLSIGCSILVLFLRAVLRLRESDALQSGFVHARSQICCLRVNAASFLVGQSDCFTFRSLSFSLSPPPPPPLSPLFNEITQMSPSQANETLNIASTGRIHQSERK